MLSLLYNFTFTAHHYFAAGRWAKYCAGISQKRMSTFHEIFWTNYQRPWLGHRLTTSQYVMYFRSCGRRHVFTYSGSTSDLTPPAWAISTRLQRQKKISLGDAADGGLEAKSTVSDCLVCHCSSPRESEGVCFYRRWFVCLSFCVSVTTITKKIVDGFVPNFMGRFLGGKGRPSSCFFTIGRWMWK